MCTPDTTSSNTICMAEMPAMAARFHHGKLLISNALQRALTPEIIRSILERHLSGDWGEYGKHFAQANERSLASGGEIESMFAITVMVQVGVSTSHDKRDTTI